MCVKHLTLFRNTVKLLEIHMHGIWHMQLFCAHL